MKELTRAEEQIMQELWLLEKAFVKEIVDKLPEPKPAYNTVSTIIRILEKKRVCRSLRVWENTPVFSADQQNGLHEIVLQKFPQWLFQQFISGNGFVFCQGRQNDPLGT